MLQFPRTTGKIQHVDANHYDDLVNKFVDQVTSVDNVLGVVLFGSVSTPGLSDIDLVVTVADGRPWPRWQDISLKRLAKGHPAESVVAHDVFVWPESVSKNAESFFYVDQQTVLHGDRLGGNIDDSLNERFRELLTMDYLIHRFESLSALLCSKQVALRSIMLFISTFRHTCHLASELGLITEQEAERTVADINALRLLSVSGSVTQKHFLGWPERLIRLLWKTVIKLAERLGLDDSGISKKIWQPNPRVVLLNSFATDGVEQWHKCIEAQRNHFFGKYVRAIPIPAVTLSHVQEYCDPKSDSGRYLKQQFPSIFGLCTGSGTTPARQTRIESVIQHWDLLSNADYIDSSGKGYAGIGMPSTPTIKKECLRQLAKFNAFLMPSMKDTGETHSNKK